jgi:hypothetical protein
MANHNYKNEKLIWGHEGKRFDEDDVDDYYRLTNMF